MSVLLTYQERIDRCKNVKKIFDRFKEAMEACILSENAQGRSQSIDVADCAASLQMMTCLECPFVQKDLIGEISHVITIMMLYKVMEEPNARFVSGPVSDFDRYVIREYWLNENGQTNFGLPTDILVDPPILYFARNIEDFRRSTTGQAYFRDASNKFIFESRLYTFLVSASDDRNNIPEADQCTYRLLLEWSAHYFDGSWEEFVEQLGVLAENVRNQTLQQYRDQKIIELFSMFSTISNYFDERIEDHRNEEKLVAFKLAKPNYPPFLYEFIGRKMDIVPVDENEFWVDWEGLPKTKNYLLTF